MNTFDARLRSARARQRRVFAFVVLGAVAAVVLVVAFWASTQGVSLIVTPRAAADTLELRTLQGFGFTAATSVYAFGDVVVEARAPGFVTERIAVASGKQSTFLEVAMREAPASLQVTTVPEADDTGWFLNGAPVATSRSLSLETAAGTHTIVINHLYYQKAALEVFVGRGQRFRREVRLAPLRGEIRIRTTPPGAMVSMDGAIRGAAPGVYPTAGGRRTVRVTHPGYEEVRDTINITNAAAVVVRNYRLRPQGAFVRFRLHPPGGRLTLDGKRVDAAGRVRVDSMREHVASYFKPGWLAQTETFTLPPSGEREVHLSLREEIGVVEVVSRPPATVSVNGESAGVTPLTLRLRAVMHEITVAREGYRSVTRKLTPASGAARKVDVTLVEEASARLAESPAVYKNSIGMTLRLFRRPGVFEMGAPRHERGQRANEFRRKVRLEKAFYAATHETTAAQYARYKGGGGAPSGSPGVPATGVTWLQAAAFCNWLSAREGLRPFYRLQHGRYLGADVRADGYRLLTEAEWEWLARKAGRARQTRFTWGDADAVPAAAGNLADRSAKGKLQSYIPNYSDGYDGLAPVASFAADRSGLYDLSGNVSEWVHDVYSLAPPAPGVEVDPVGRAVGQAHVFKGSNWRSATITELRASFRETAAAGRDDLGFRVARYLYGGENTDDQ